MFHTSGVRLMIQVYIKKRMSFVDLTIVLDFIYVFKYYYINNMHL
jgi:hypothetical protein